jgi:hypothetical protein
MSAYHRCPIQCCQRKVQHHLLMCKHHWAMVPATRQQAVYAAWNGGRPTDDHGMACRQAIDAVEESVARQVAGMVLPW